MRYPPLVLPQFELSVSSIRAAVGKIRISVSDLSGYIPLFDSLTRGTLCGKWPDIGLWPVLLSMCDWRGEIDATHQYIATVTGLPLAEVAACIDRFCQPDPGSRSNEAKGARLVPVDPGRDWGWRVVNVQLYREKASDMAQIADGRNAEKVRRYKERHRQTPEDTAGHRTTPPDTNSYSYSYSNKEKTKEAQAPVNGLDIEAWDKWMVYCAEKRKKLTPSGIAAAQRKLAKLGPIQSEAVEHSIACNYTGIYPPTSNGKSGKITQWE